MEQKINKLIPIISDLYHAESAERRQIILENLANDETVAESEKFDVAIAFSELTFNVNLESLYYKIYNSGLFLNLVNLLYEDTLSKYIYGLTDYLPFFYKKYSGEVSSLRSLNLYIASMTLSKLLLVGKSEFNKNLTTSV